MQYRCPRVCNRARLALVWARGATNKLCSGTLGYDYSIWELSQWDELRYKPFWGHRYISFRCKRRREDHRSSDRPVRSSRWTSGLRPVVWSQWAADIKG